jgi:hypothetical protein
MEHEPFPPETTVAVSASVTRSWFGQAWEVASDLILATLIVWTLPLLLGAAAAALRLLRSWL